MKYITVSLLAIGLVGCTTTTTTLPDGTKTTIRTVDHKAVVELEPLVQTFGAGAMQGALQYLQQQQQKP